MSRLDEIADAALSRWRWETNEEFRALITWTARAVAEDAVDFLGHMHLMDHWRVGETMVDAERRAFRARYGLDAHVIRHPEEGP